jgi:hypothetical protein
MAKSTWWCMAPTGNDSEKSRCIRLTNSRVCETCAKSQDIWHFFSSTPLANTVTF